MIFKIIAIVLHLTNGEVVRIPLSLIPEYTCFDYLQKVAIVENKDDLPLYQKKKVWGYYCKNSLSGHWIQ